MIVLIIDLLIFALFGIPICLLQAFYDTCKFVANLYNKNLRLRYNDKQGMFLSYASVTEKLDAKFYHLFIRFLRQYPHKQATAKLLIQDLSEVLCIHKQIRTILFQTNEKGE